MTRTSGRGVLRTGSWNRKGGRYKSKVPDGGWCESGYSVPGSGGLERYEEGPATVRDLLRSRGGGRDVAVTPSDRRIRVQGSPE